MTTLTKKTNKTALQKYNLLGTLTNKDKKIQPKSFSVGNGMSNSKDITDIQDMKSYTISNSVILRII